jgi:hypothetical protein
VVDSGKQWEIYKKLSKLCSSQWKRITKRSASRESSINNPTTWGSSSSNIPSNFKAFDRFSLFNLEVHKIWEDIHSGKVEENNFGSTLVTT